MGFHNPAREVIRSLDRRSALKMTGVSVAAAWLSTAARASSAGSPGKADTATAPVADPLRRELSYEALVTIAPAVEIGPSSRGTRRYIPITGGTFQGPRIKGVVLSGGADWQLQRPDGTTEIDALYSMKADDGAVIIVRNRGLISKGGAYFRTIPEFEAPVGPHDWLNQAVFVGSVSGAPQPGAVIIRVFQVL